MPKRTATMLKPRRIAIGAENPRGADMRRLESQAA